MLECLDPLSHIFLHFGHVCLRISLIASVACGAGVERLQPIVASAVKSFDRGHSVVDV